MTDKEKKLTKALKEYFGKDVGDVVYVDAGSIYDPALMARYESQIMITTAPHKLTFEEKRKELVDQLDKELKEIDDDFKIKTSGGCPGVVYIWLHSRPFCELYTDGTINLHGTNTDVKQMTRAMEAISGFSWKLKRLREKYKND